MPNLPPRDISVILVRVRGPMKMPPPSRAATAISFAIATATAVISVPSASGTITMDGGSYKNVVVSISPDVPEDADLLLGLYK